MLENQSNDLEDGQDIADAILEGVFGKQESGPAESPVADQVVSEIDVKETANTNSEELVAVIERMPEEVTSVVVSETPVKKFKSKNVKPEADAHADADADADEITFASLPLCAEVQQAVEKSRYQQPTPIQAQIIPYLLEGRDVLAQSQTGTGKTAAFALPILTRIETECKTPQVLVLTPTRELAIQVAKSFATYGANIEGFEHAVIYGGQDYEIQHRQLRRGPQVVVGTPGRVIDHIKRGTLNISEIECLVLDEADEMLNMGFLEDVKFVLDQAPEHRQIALFSATLPPPIRTIAQRYLNDPAKVTIKEKTMTAESIRQRAVFVAPRDKVDLLIRFLEAENADGVIVFTRTREATSVVADKLIRAGLRAVALNGDMPQRSRERTIERLKAGQIDVLVATDVAARGLDVPRISHVFNFDFPEGSEAYIHRVGRTGRAGKIGQAIIFLSHAQRSKLRFIEKATRQPIEMVDAPSIKQINTMRVKRYYEAIDKTIAERDLSFFKKLVDEYTEQSGQPSDVIAAAIAMIGQNGRDFQMKDRPKRESSDRRERERGGKQTRGGKRERVGGPPESGMARYRIAVGKRDGIRPGNIVGAVTNEANIDGGDIGSIQIHESFTTIDLPADKGADIAERLQDTRVSGRPMQLRLADERDSHSSKPRGRRDNADSRNRGDKFNGGGKKKDGKWQKAKRRDNKSNGPGDNFAKGKSDGGESNKNSSESKPKSRISNGKPKSKFDGPKTNGKFGKSKSKIKTSGAKAKSILGGKKKKVVRKFDAKSN